MSEYLKKIKRRTLVYAITGLSMFGGVNKINAQDSDKQDINALHSSYVVYNAKYKAYRDNINVTCGNKNFSKSQHIIIRDVGDGYSIIHEFLNTDNLKENNVKNESKMMLTPDGRMINLDFYDSKGAMPIAEAYNNKKYKDTPDEIMKNHNDKWELQQLKKSYKKLKTEKDRAAFARYLKQEREFLESDIISPEITEEQKVVGFTDRFFISKDNNNTTIDLREVYNDLKQKAKNSLNDVKNKALSGNKNLTKILPNSRE